MPYGAEYSLLQDGRPVALERTTSWDYPWRARLSVASGSARIELVRGGD